MFNRSARARARLISQRIAVGLFIRIADNKTAHGASARGGSMKFDNLYSRYLYPFCILFAFM